ncbi:MAG: hypothetical protein HRU72_04865 [Planctomycetia bacterium]|nr:hypothetical protein [Candidatus Brocadia sp.]QOJ05924.1 MAG: hypothetical protein HRU72_04865 [Planctomycetia bacterium]HQU31089.1 hypothetical protein [Candidatus Brocadia sapporoensis]
MRTQHGRECLIATLKATINLAVILNPIGIVTALSVYQLLTHLVADNFKIVSQHEAEERVA